MRFAEWLRDLSTLPLCGETPRATTHVRGRAYRG